MANQPTRAVHRGPDANLYTWHAEVRASELDVAVERSRVRYRGGAEDGPPVEIVRGRDLLERPVQVRYAERYRAGYPGSW
jgi:hypothetical protein